MFNKTVFMKNKKLSTTRILIVLLLSVFSFAGAVTAQSVSMSITNCEVTAPNEIQFDITATNLTAANILHWNSAVIRLSYSTGFLASTADAVVWGYVSGSDFPLSLPPNASPTFTSNPLGATKLQLQTGSGIYNNSPCNATTAIAAGATAKIGRFFLRDNTANFVAGQSVGLTWITSSGLVLYLDCATTVTNYNTAGTRTLNAPCSLTIPAGCTSPTVGGSPSDQSVCTTGTASFTGSFTGGAPTPTTIWQVQTGGVGLFTDLTEAAPYSGTATNTLTITTPNISLSTNRYRMKTGNCTDVFTNSALLTVNPSVTAGTVSGTSPLCIGATASYSSNGTAGGTWSSTNALVASVNGAGLVTALTSGTTDITYTVAAGCGSPVSSFLTLTVNPNVTAGTVSGTSPLCIGATAAYSSNGTAGGTWSSTNALVASVDGAGLVTALTSGTTDITYTVSAGCGSPVSSFSTLTVSPNVSAGTVSGTSPLCGGLTTVYTSDGTAGGTWSSSNPAIASVNPATGLVTSLTAGTTDITYTVNAGCGSPVSSFKTLTVTGSAGLAGVAGGPMVCSNATVQPTGTTFSDGTCKSIANIVPSGLVPVTGDINVCVTVDDQVYTYQTRPYVQRHYDIVPVTNAANATATITLYFTQGEFDAYNLARGLNPALPAEATDAANNKINLRVTQFHGTGTYPGNYTGPANPDLINPDDNNIVWNAGLSRWEVTFNVNGFSGFYIFTSLINTPLPVDLLSFNGRNNGNANLLEWSTSSEQNSSYFELERSIDGISYTKAGRVSASGNSSVTRQYSFIDDISSLDAKLFYYRLKQVDISGLAKYSTVVKIKLNSKGFAVEASPNPFADQMRVQIEATQKENAVIILTNLDGKRILVQNCSINKGSNVILLDKLDNLPGGVYLLHVNTGTEKRTLKVMKQK